MATDEWLAYGGTELVNLARTTALAVSLGIDTLWTDPEAVAWVEDARNGEDYDLITTAPWYDPGYPASGEFAGIVPISIAGLDDSTKEATTTEYITDGGASGKPRNKTLNLVCNVAVVASTERGADFGKRWLDRVLTGSRTTTFCSGEDLHYYQWEPSEETPLPPLVHRRDVSISRGTTVTRKRTNYCSSVWTVAFTLVANDAFEYGEAEQRFVDLGNGGTGVPHRTDDVYPGYITGHGELMMTESSCPVYDYSPIYDPLYPALIAPPTAPDFYPEGWYLPDGAEFKRYWVRMDPFEPSDLAFVPVFTARAEFGEARMVRIQMWNGDENVDAWCDPLWTGIIKYMPKDMDFVIDGEQRVSYAWDGLSPVVRRTDSLVFSDEARPIDWSSLTNPRGLLVTLDLLTGQVGGTVAVGLDLVRRSD